jgi:hypothetical protein
MSFVCTCVLYGPSFLQKTELKLSEVGVVWPTQPPIQRVPAALSLGVKRPGREADNSPPSSTEAKE